MKKKAELLKSINAQRKVVLDLLQKGSVDEAKTASDALEKMQNEYDALPEDVVTERMSKPMDKKERMAQIKKAVNSFLHKGWAGMTDEEKAIVKPVNATDAPGQVELANRGLALIPVDTADFTLMMDSGVYRLRDKCFQYTTNTKTGKIPMVDNPSDTLTDFDELPVGGLAKKQIAIKQVDFNIHDVGEIIPVSNQMLADENQSVFELIMNVMAKKLRNTENAKILAKLNSLGTATPITGWQDLVKAINECDPVDGSEKVIITNTDGGNYLQTLIDNNHYMLVQPDPTSPRKWFRGYEVIQLPVSQLATDDTDGIPFFVGSLKDAIVYVERSGLLVSYNPYGAGFAQDATEVRVTARLDVETAFTNAMKKLTLAQD